MPLNYYEPCASRRLGAAVARRMGLGIGQIPYPIFAVDLKVCPRVGVNAGRIHFSIPFVWMLTQ